MGPGMQKSHSHQQHLSARSNKSKKSHRSIKSMSFRDIVQGQEEIGQAAFVETSEDSEPEMRSPDKMMKGLTKETRVNKRRK